MDVEYISLHGYIKKSTSETEVHAEHQLRADRSTWQAEKKKKKYIEQHKTP